MKQIILNYLCIVGLPLALGLAVRFAFRHVKRGYLITMGLITLALAAWIVVWTVPSYGSEQNGLLAIMATCAATASLLTGAILRLKNDFCSRVK